MSCGYNDELFKKKSLDLRIHTRVSLDELSLAHAFLKTYPATELSQATYTELGKLRRFLSDCLEQVGHEGLTAKLMDLNVKEHFEESRKYVEALAKPYNREIFIR